MTAPDVYEDPLPDAKTVSTVQELAVAALYTALHRDSDTFIINFKRLIDEHFVYISVAFAAWCDLAINAIDIVSGSLERKSDLLAFVYRTESERGEEAQWGARILKARADDDRDAYLTALGEFNTLTARAKVQRIRALLGATVTCVAATQAFAEDATVDFRG